MALGFLPHQGGVMASPDVEGAGVDAWTRVAGIPPTSSLVGGPGHPDDGYHMPYNVDRARGRIVTTDQTGNSPIGPASHAKLLDDWRDVLNFRNSPVPWLLVFSLAILGLMQFRLMVRAGGRGADIKLG